MLDMKQIEPFSMYEYEGSYGLTLYSSEKYKARIFRLRLFEGFRPNGYGWESLAIAFIKEKMPELNDYFEFDSEAGMFAMYSRNEKALENFALAFKDACENDALIRDIFSRAELV